MDVLGRSNISDEVKEDIFISAPPLASSRYNRQLLIPSISLRGQTRISRSKVLIVGLGGLGCPAALYLAGSGVDTLGLLDDDVVELSNLHRQIAHREESAGRGLSKTESARRSCLELNSEVNYVCYEMRLGAGSGDGATGMEEVLDIIQGYDIVLDCTDNPATRYLVSDVCVLLGKTLVSGAAQKLEGQLMVLNYPRPGTGMTQDRSHSTRTTTKATATDADTTNSEKNVLPNEHGEEEKEIENERRNEEKQGGGRGPCYRCVFPKPPAPETVRGCSEIGILGPVVGTIGTLMASEALRCIVRGGVVGSSNSTNDDEEIEDRKPSMLLYQAWPSDPRNMFRSIGLMGKRTSCVACADPAFLAKKGLKRLTIDDFRHGRMDYIGFCGVETDVDLLSTEERIDAEEFVRNCKNGMAAPPISAPSTSVSQATTKEHTSHNFTIIDVREEHEVELGPKIARSINVPLTKIMRENRAGDEVQHSGVLRLDAATNDGSCDAIYFVCQRGNDSQIAASKILERRRERRSETHGQTSTPTRFIGDVRGGFMAIEQVLKREKGGEESKRETDNTSEPQSRSQSESMSHVRPDRGPLVLAPFQQGHYLYQMKQ